MTEPNFANRTLYHGNNLDFLRGMDSGTINLIATDPPFNKSKDFHATPDSLAAGASFQDRWSWRDDIHDEWLIAIQRDEPEVWQVISTAKVVYGDDMGAFLCWMGVRLLEMHRILADDGSLYLHIDHTAHAWVKCLLDAIFGRDNFRDAVVWNRAAENLSRKKFRRAAETLLYYTKSDTFVWNAQYEALDKEQQARDYRYTDKRGQYTTTSCTNNADRPNMVYEFHGNVRQWRYSQETMREYERQGLLVFNKDGVPRKKRYLDQVEGRGLTNVWSDINVLASNDRERTGYPTQKPVSLYERVIKASTNVGDWVLDPFCGCATTPIAAERLGRRWVGMDIWEGAVGQVRTRMEANRQLLTGTDPKVTYTTTPPPFARTRARQPRWCCECRPPVSRVTRAHEASTGHYCKSLGHTAKAAGRTTPLTRVCWKWTTSALRTTAGATLTTT